MAIYSDKFIDHFMNPRNVGELEDHNGIGEAGELVCGDMTTFMIKVKNDRIEDVCFRTFGCGAAIAVSSMTSEMAKGKTLDEAMKITNSMVADQLEGLPSDKMHCSNLGADALHKAIENYRERESLSAYSGDGKSPADDNKTTKCPFCDQPIVEKTPCDEMDVVDDY